MKKILITGTLGFIFSNFVRKAAYEKAPYTYCAVDKATNSSTINSNIYINKSLTSNYIADICDSHIMDTIFKFEGPDIVVHGAAESCVDDSLKDPNVFIQSNVLGTQVMINVARKYNVKKFIYISTDEVYGALKSEDEPSWTEQSPMNPRNPYSASKASGELLVKAAHESFGLPYIITRSCNNYGPRQTPNKFIPRIIKSILNKEKIPVYGQGLQIRDWLHVFDNCSAILKILEKGELNNTYNISANQEFSNIEVVNQVCNAMGEGHSLVTHVEDRKGHDFRYSIDSSKLKTLGWSPSVKFKDGVIETCDWYKQNSYFLR